MDAKSRIQTLRLIDRMTEHPEQAKALGLTDQSTFHGKPLSPGDTKSAPLPKTTNEIGKH